MTPRCPPARPWARGPDAFSSPCAGGDRSSLGSTGSVASARSSGSGQSAGSGAHALHAGSEGVKVRPGAGWGLQVAPGSGIGACSGAGLGSLGSRDPILSSAAGSLLRLTLSPALRGAAGTRRGCHCPRSAACPLPAGPGCWLSSAPLSSVWPRPEACVSAASLRLRLRCALHCSLRTAAHPLQPRAARCHLPAARSCAGHCCPLHGAHCTLHSTQCVLHTAHCALHAAHHALLTTHCMLCRSSLPPALCALPTAAPAHDIPSR